MPRIDTDQLVSWLRDKAARAPELSWMRMMNACADRLEEYAGMAGSLKVHDYCWARSKAELESLLSRLDDSGFELVSVSIMDGGSYMVFFWRPAP